MRIYVTLAFLPVPEWRNWQTRGTQNPESLTGRVGSIPTSGTNPYDAANPCSRSLAMSLVGALPKRRAYSRLNCEALR